MIKFYYESFIGNFGGVDSAVSAYLLKEKGYEVVAAMMKTYSGIPLGSACYGSNKEKEIYDAKKICDKLSIDFNLIDCTKEFNDFVFEEFRDQYKKGLTPNPCVLCNPKVKFGAFLELAEKEGIRFDKFSTGHYANIVFENGRYALSMGKNRKKDQSYFLYRLNQEQLSKIIFPLGNLDKEETRDIARKCGFEISEKKDSQDFYDGHYSEILNFKDRKGEIVTTKGEILGEHNGIHYFTIGQRKGLKIAYEEPLYVISLDSENNRVIVGTREETFCDSLVAYDINWGLIESLKDRRKAFCKHRSVQNPNPCIIEPYGDKIKVKFDSAQTSVTKGQSAVFYDSEGRILCGGFIE